MSRTRRLQRGATGENGQYVHADIMSTARNLTRLEIESAVALRQTDLLDRMEAAVESVRQRMVRASQCLQAAGIPHAIVGGNAVAAWVATVDPSAARNTQDVDILARKEDFPKIVDALSAVGFVYRQVLGVDVFLDGPDALPSQAVHVVWAGQKVKEHYVETSPDTSCCLSINGLQMLELDSLVRMKLTSFRRKDQVHIQDLIGVGLVTNDWPERLPPVLAERLRQLLADPEG